MVGSFQVSIYIYIQLKHIFILMLALSAYIMNNLLYNLYFVICILNEHIISKTLETMKPNEKVKKHTKTNDKG